MKHERIIKERKTSGRKLTAVLFAVVHLLTGVSGLQAQDSGLDLSPVRYELEMQPGTDRTVVVNAVFHAPASTAVTTREIATVSDWTIETNGSVRFLKAGSLPDSSSPWMIHSPVEFSLAPNVLQPIRITISVPRDAKAGEYRSALIMEERPVSNRDAAAVRALNVRYRFAVLFYVMVSGKIPKAELTGLSVEADGKNVKVIPFLKNDGNVHLRPSARIAILDPQENVVFERPESAMTVLLSGAQLAEPVSFEKDLPPGRYQLRCTIDFGERLPLQVGKTKFKIGNPLVASGFSSPR